MALVLKTKIFTRWQRGEGLPDSALCAAVREMERGMFDADLGGHLYKKRVARPGGGKRGGYRTMIFAVLGSQYVFLYGFAKSGASNVSDPEKRALRFTGAEILTLGPDAREKALEAKELLEVTCEHDH
jgi:hypothetical protein